MLSLFTLKLNKSNLADQTLKVMSNIATPLQGFYKILVHFVHLDKDKETFINQMSFV